MTARSSVIGWTLASFMVAATLAAYLHLVGHVEFSYFVVTAGFLLATLGIYKEKA